MSSNGLFHPVPEIKKVSLTGKNRVREALIMREVKLPYAEQTHEVCWDKKNQACYVTQLTSSTLVRLTVDENGILKDEMDAWKIGPDDGQLHNVSMSVTQPGFLWLSLQAINTLLLVDGNPGDDFMKVKEVYQTPCFVNLDGKDQYVGTPHCIRESPDGTVWACLKGALSKDHPCAKVSSCCDPEKLLAAIKKHQDDEKFDIYNPDGYAVWQLDRSKYDPKCRYRGGKVYKCLNSPPMACVDKNNNLWVTQDQSSTVLCIDTSTDTPHQYQLPWPLGTNPKEKHTGPGIAAAPDGSIWMTELEASGALIRIDPDTKKFSLYEIEPPAWSPDMRMIHLDFHPASKGTKHYNRIYAICSSLLDDSSNDAVIIMNMCPDWKKVLGIRIIPLPSQFSACHRICYAEIDDHDDEVDDGSVFITEMSKAKLLQIKVNHDVTMNHVDHSHYIHGEYECNRYKVADVIDGWRLDLDASPPVDPTYLPADS